MKSYNPYGWQRQFVTASSDCFQLLAMTGNRCGKTYTGGFIMACHLTGIYPDWWDGKRFYEPIEAWASGISTDTTRDILQSELLGDWKNPDAYGTGMIPKECIVDTVNKPQTPGAVQSVLVRHVSGGISTLDFKSYEMSQDKFMGTAKHVIWLDEECPKNIYTQCVTRTATTGGIVYMTYTPEAGMTELCRDFLFDLKKGQFLIQASWDDAPHLTDAVKEQLMSVYSPAERAMRVSGMPSIGTGVVFPIKAEDITIDPIDIPDHWLKIVGIDLGFDHPNGVACIAWDNVEDCYYLYDEHSEKGETLSMHASAIRSKGGDQFPVVVPHDAFKRDSATTGVQFVKILENYGLNIVMQPFSNPMGADGKAGGNNVEVGCAIMMRAMEEGRFKVFRTCTKFLQELPLYHRKDGKIHDRNDDMISATRYAMIMAPRFAIQGGLRSNSGYSYSSKPLTPSWYDEII